MTAGPAYCTPVKKVRTRFTVQGSKFISTLAAVEDEETARLAISEIGREFPDASHHAFAYRIGCGSALVERASDDREPAGTAGAPMLQVLQGGNISDALVVATRYFGGTKLGIGGLTRAYRECARLCLAGAVLQKKEPLREYILKLDYEDLGAVTKLLESLGASVASADYGAAVTMQILIPARKGAVLKKKFQNACRGRGLITGP